MLLNGRSWRPENRRFVRELLLLACMGSALVTTLILANLTLAADHFVYDRWMRYRAFPADADIVIVRIDDNSLAQVGRWPWRRDVHAQLLKRISAASPRAVLYDVLFTEPSPEDQILADAMSGARVYLPLIVESDTSAASPGHGILPVPVLEHAAAGIGHVNLEADQDGIVRSVALLEGNSEQLWPQFTEPVLQSLRGKTYSLPGTDAADRAGTGLSQHGELRRTNHILLPFASAPYPQVSAIDVLNGDVPPNFFANRFVLVGATAGGLAERISTSASSERGALSGVELHANVLDALLTERSIEPASNVTRIGFCLAPVILLLAGFLYLTPRQCLFAQPLLISGWFALSYLIFSQASVWVSPVPAAICLLCVHVIWNWRRLEVIITFVGAELEQLAREEPLLRSRLHHGQLTIGYELERDIRLMRQAARQVHDLKRLIWDSLNSLPDPVLMADDQGNVRLANDPARACLRAPGQEKLEGNSLCDLLGHWTFINVAGVAAGPEVKVAWPDALLPERPGFMIVASHGIEIRDPLGRRYVLRFAPCRNAAGELFGWICCLSDVTTLHAAQLQRDEMLHLLSHDMRSPQSSIIALVDIERRKTELAGVRLAFDRVERYARRTLALADSFVRLAKAETQDFELDIFDFANCVHAAIDEVWPLASTREIEVICDEDIAELPVRANRSLIVRALVNLLNNAIKYSPRNTEIHCRLRSEDKPIKQIVCEIEDQGYGISPEHRTQLFNRFKRFRVAGQPDSDGVGLGLTFVKTVLVRHGGSIDCDSTPGQGTTMTVRLPYASTSLESASNGRDNGPLSSRS
ncbi:CHASE2 domain-containing protein [Paraburkholderia sp. BR14263]|uniref:CHASE2 domain-containing protein n=1 Tax=unclassified Paraburkholderia TaxID=2615204 RepID=UPI0034CEA750